MSITLSSEHCTAPCVRLLAAGPNQASLLLVIGDGPNQADILKRRFHAPSLDQLPSSRKHHARHLLLLPLKSQLWLSHSRREGGES